MPPFHFTEAEFPLTERPLSAPATTGMLSVAESADFASMRTRPRENIHFIVTSPATRDIPRPHSLARVSNDTQPSVSLTVPSASSSKPVDMMPSLDTTHGVSTALGAVRGSCMLRGSTDLQSSAD